MQTRSKGPVTYGEKVQQEVFDPYGNLISKGTIYDIPNVGKYNSFKGGVFTIKIEKLYHRRHNRIGFSRQNYPRIFGLRPS